MPRIAAVVLCLATVASAAQTPPPAAAADELPTLLILNIEAQGVSREEAAAVTDAVVQALAKRGLFRVASSKDLQTLISAERQRQLVSGCADDTCARDFGSLVNAKYVLSGSLSKVGSAVQLALQTLDTEKNVPMGRSSRLANDLSTLVGLVPYAAAEATGTPLPPPKPRWMQFTMIGVGGGLVLTGGVLGMYGLSQQALLSAQLCPEGVPSQSGDSCGGQNLQARRFYVDRDAEIAGYKTASLISLGVGAALLAAGIYLMPPPEGGPRMAFVLSDRGVALVGELP